MQAVLDAVAERLMAGDELLIRIPEICEATGVNYGSVYHHFGSREGVIDAAYDVIFTRLVEEDIRTFAADRRVGRCAFVSWLPPPRVRG
jgi:AcrR family transcriptional regulator